MHTSSKTFSIFVLVAASTALTLDTSTVSGISNTHVHHHHIQLMNGFTNSTSIIGIITGIISGDGGSSSTTQHGSSNSHSHHRHGSGTSIDNSIADINWYQLGN